MSSMRNISINVQTGYETWQGSSYEFRVFLSKQPGRAYKEEPLHVAANDVENSGVTSLRNPQQHLSAAGRDPQLGQWYTGVYELPEGSILKIVTSQSAAAWGDRRKALQQFVRLRNDAALCKVSMDLPDKVGRTISDAHLYGRFDIITLQDALAAGCRVHPKYHHLFDNTFGDALQFKEIEAAIRAPAVAAAHTILNAAGEAEIVTVTRRARAVRSVERPR